MLVHAEKDLHCLLMVCFVNYYFCHTPAKGRVAVDEICFLGRCRSYELYFSTAQSRLQDLSDDPICLFLKKQMYLVDKQNSLLVLVAHIVYEHFDLVFKVAHKT